MTNRITDILPYDRPVSELFAQKMYRVEVREEWMEGVGVYKIERGIPMMEISHPHIRRCAVMR